MAVMRPPVPETDVIAGRYILATHVGIGSTATVYRAWDPHEDRVVAVKLFLDRYDADGVDRQCRELRTMAHLDHPGLVRLLGGGVDRGRPFLVAELVEGETLAARLARCRSSGPSRSAPTSRRGSRTCTAVGWCTAT